MRITKTYTFEASHALPNHAGKCAGLHGHSYRLEVTVEGALQSDGTAAGMVMDFEDMSRSVRPAAVDRLDHKHLNDVVDNPTCERILVWIWSELIPQLPVLAKLTLWETATSCATLRRGDPETIR